MSKQLLKFVEELREKMSNALLDIDLKIKDIEDEDPRNNKVYVINEALPLDIAVEQALR